MIKTKLQRIISIVLTLVLLSSVMTVNLSLAEELPTVPEAAAEPVAAPEEEPTAEPAPEPEPEPEPEPAPAPEAPPADEPADKPADDKPEEPAKPEAHPYLTFKAIEGGLAVAACDPNVKKASIPATFGDLPVLAVADKAFKGCDKLQAVTVAEGVLVIGKEAFADCAALESIKLPASLTDIGTDAFEGCDMLADIDAPKESFALLFAEAWLQAHPVDGATPDEEAPEADADIEGDSADPTEPVEVDPTIPAQPEGTEPTEVVEGDNTVPTDPVEGEPKAELAADNVREPMQVLPPAEPVVASIAITGASPVLGAGKALSLKATVVTDDTSVAKVVLWSISEGAPATFKPNKLTAKLTANKAITAPTDVTVTATLAGHTDIFTSVTVTLMPVITKVTVTAPRLWLDMTKQNEGVALTATILPTSESAQPLSWKTSNAAIATVDENGVVKPGTKAGTATITATAMDGSKKSGSVKIKNVIVAEKIAIDGATSVFVGKKTAALKLAFTPSKPTSKKVVWTSDTPEVATVKNGVVTGVSAGTATITATAAEYVEGTAVSDPWTVVVRSRPVIACATESDTTTIDLGASSTLQLKATLLPEGTPQGVTWKSSVPKVATIDASGLVTGVAPGTTYITATATDGSKAVSDRFKVTVTATVSGVTISGPEQVALGKSMQLSAAFVPAGAKPLAVTWTSSDNKVATVTSKGKVTAAKGATAGATATITVAAKTNAAITAQHEVTIVAPLTAMKIESDDEDNTIDTTSDDNTIQLKATLENETTEVKALWSSSKKTVATVDANGLVTAVKAGTTVITAKAADGSPARATITIKVISSVSGVTIGGAEELTLGLGKSLKLTATLSPTLVDDKTVV